jgi:hypothetical protein
MALEVIGVGLGRTGTLSLKGAFEKLGFGPCYGRRRIAGATHHSCMRSESRTELSAIEGPNSWLVGRSAPRRRGCRNGFKFVQLANVRKQGRALR